VTDAPERARRPRGSLFTGASFAQQLAPGEYLTERICNFFCGAHARFEGLYLKVAGACLSKNVRDARAAFKRAYDRKEYPPQRRTLRRS
jgi:hypothetical protein